MANYTSTHSGAVIDAAVTKITATSSSATELNILDGVTATTAELNILDGVTSTTAELNILDGVTATTAEINYIDGVTSNIQTQLNLKAPLAGASLTGTTSFQNLSDGTITITAFADEDDMSSNSATLIPTQQSVKAYVDTTAQTTEEVQDIVGAMFSSNTESGITVTYEDGDGTIDLSVATQSDNNFTTTLKNKLDAIEASATADQTASEIRTLVESASDSNVFTDDDHSKLNAIEASATADQTNAEIRTAVEAASDSNVFTDADHSKLNAIEASADVTDTANVTSAGALMDSELTSIADVKALDQSVVSGASPTFGTANMSDASNKRFMTDAQETKLDSVESNADVTDTANVTSAGALMDSELTDLAGVKGVTISTLQPKPSEGAFANGDKTKLDGIESGATADQTDEEIQDVVGAMFSSNTETGITATYQDGDGTIDLVVGTLNQDTTGNAATATKIASITNSDIVQLTSSQTLTNKTLTSPVINTGISGSAILDEDDMTSNSATKLSTQQSIKAYVDAEVAGVVDTAPAALNTLNELAAALGDDANFSTTTSTALGNRLRVDTASQGLTGTQQANAITNLGITSTKAELNILDGVTATAAELNIMDGVTATTAELNYTDGVTSNIQTQLDATLDTAGTGIDISSTTISVDVSDFMTNGSNNRILTATGTDAMNAEANLTFDGSTLALTGTLTSTGHLKIADGQAYMAGGGEDVQLFHSDTYGGFLFNQTNHFYFDQVAADKDWIFRVDDSDGGGDYQEVMRIQGSTKNVGIGTNSPDYELDVAGDIGVDHLITHNSDSNTYVQFTSDRLRFAAGGEVLLDLFEDGTQDYVKLGDGGDVDINLNDDMFVQGSSGNVGIGTTSPDKKLEVSGDIKISGGDYNGLFFENAAGTTNALLYQHTANAALIIKDIVNNTDRVWFGYDGDVGIGQNPTAKLDVVGNIKSSGHLVLPYGEINDAGTDMNIVSDNALTLGTESGTALTFANASLRGVFADDVSIPVAKKLYFGGGDHTYIGEDADDRLRFFTGGAEFMRFTESTDNSLNIYEDVYVADDKKIHFGAGNDIKIYHNSSSGNANIENYTGDIYVTNYTDDGDIFFRVDDGGSNVITAIQIDASDAGTATFNHDILLNKELSAIRFGASQQGSIYEHASDIIISNSAAGNDTIFENLNSAGSEYVKNLFIDGSTSRIGIGTTSPAEKLHVSGNIKIGDGNELRIGDGNDLRFIHSSNSFMDNYTGHLYIRQHQSDHDIFFQVNDGGSTGQTVMTLDGSEQRVGIGTTSPEGKVHIYNGDASVAPDGDGDELVIENSGDSGISILSGESSTHTGAVIFGSANDAFGAALQYSYHGNKLRLMTANTGHKLEFATDNNTTAMTIDAQRNIKIFDNGTNPSASAENAFLFCDSGELKVLDELGHTTTISPHNFDLIPGGASEERAWGYYSEKDIVDDEGNVTTTQKVNVDMMRLARLVEELTGEKLVYTEET